jgi:hypothetical protein
MPVHWLQTLRHRGSRSAANGRGDPPASGNTPPRLRAPGEPYTTLTGLRVSALALHRGGASATQGTSFVLQVRVENPTTEPLVFDNSFGVVDGHGAAHPRGYTDQPVVQPLLPASTTVEPGGAIEGAVYVHVGNGTPPFHSAYLAAVEHGCSGCPGGAGVDLIPLALWQNVLQDGD